jgi:hypothetical protein
METPAMPTLLDKEVKRGSTEMLILALVEDRPRHGYEIARLIEERSDGVLQFMWRRSIPCSTGWKNAASSKARGLKRPGSGDGGFTSSCRKEKKRSMNNGRLGRTFSPRWIAWPKSTRRE